MSNCPCKNCTGRHRPTREEMTLLHGDADREIRAAIVHGVLVIDAYDAAGDGTWERDPEYGGAIGEAGFEPLRKLLEADSAKAWLGFNTKEENIPIGPE